MGRGNARRPRPLKLPAPDRLLTREDFRRFVLLRARGRCVVCGAPAVDAHHIEPRRAFPDGGYYLANGVALCASDHERAERGELEKDELRRLAGIALVIQPPAGA